MIMMKRPEQAGRDSDLGFFTSLSAAKSELGFFRSHSVSIIDRRPSHLSRPSLFFGFLTHSQNQFEEMQSFCGRIRVVARHKINNVKIVDPKSTRGYGLSSSESNAFTSKGGVAKSFESPIDYSIGGISELALKFVSRSLMVLHKKFGQETYSRSSNNSGTTSVTPFSRDPRPSIFQWATMVPTFPSRCIATVNYSSESVSKDTSASISESEVAPRIKFKRLDKTAKHIMQILDKEAVEEVRSKREIPDIKPGYIIQLKLEVPENKRRNSLVKGIVIARRNAGLNTTIRLRRMVAGVGVESLLPLYSPNIKEIKVLDKKKVRRAKLYYLREKLNPLRNK